MMSQLIFKYHYFTCLTTGEVFFFAFYLEVCPFCGKTYKRLKSHLPHCKAAASSDTPPVSREAAQTREPPRLSSLKEEKPPPKLPFSAGLQSKKSKKVSAQTGLQTGNSSPPKLASSATLPSSARKKKQKVSEQMKAATAPPSAAVSPTSQPRSLHPTTSKIAKTTDHDFIEAAVPQKITKGAPERTRAQLVAQTKISREEGISPPASQPTGNQGSAKMKVSKEKATQALSSRENYKPNEKTAGARERNHNWSTTERKLNDLSVDMDSGDGHQSKITLQDVKAALGRDRKALKSSRPSILVQISDPSSRVAASAAFTPASLPAGNRGEQLSTSSTSPSKPASANPPDASPQLAPASLPPGGLSPQGHRAVTGLSTVTVSTSLIPFTSTKLLPASVEGARDGLIKHKMQLEDRKPSVSDGRTKG